MPSTLVSIGSQEIVFGADDDIFELDRPLFFHCKKSKYIFKVDKFYSENGIRSELPSEVVFVGESFTVHDTTDHLVHENMTKESKIDHIKHKNLSGFVAGTDKISSRMSANLKTDVINSRVSANLKTDKLDTFDSVKKVDEDKVFAMQRAAPRARPKKEKKVTLKLLDSSDKVLIYSLFDLSTGGMAFKISGKEMFQKNDKLLVTAIDGKDLDKPMIGIIRNIIEDGLHSFRVGVQFIDEEDS